MLRAEQLTAAVCEHGEGPVWSEAWGGLQWVDMLAGDIMSLTPTGAVERRHIGEFVAAVHPRSGGGSVIAAARGFVIEDRDGSLTVLGDLWQDPDTQMNDGACDPHGRFLCGSKAPDDQPGGGALYCLSTDRNVEVALESVTVSNGLDWSLDEQTAYYVDSPTQKITAFDQDDDGRLVNGRVFAQIPRERGEPDGLTVDAEGGVWVALYGGGAVHRFTPDGELDTVVSVPVSNVTSLTFGGSQLDRLFITTSRLQSPSNTEPRAGALFSFDPGVRGLPARSYAG